MASQEYLVLIGDLKGSRALNTQERKEAQGKLSDVLEHIRKDASPFASLPTITLGDEFQAVYQTADVLFLHIWRIQATLYPIDLRFGLGMGRLSTEVKREQAIGMDGPAFHRARAAMEYLKKEKGWFRIEGKEDDTQSIRLINHSLDLVTHEMRGWKHHRFGILWRSRAGQDYKAITDELGISKAAFYKNVEAGALETIIDLGNITAEIINEHLEQ